MPLVKQGELWKPARPLLLRAGVILAAYAVANAAGLRADMTLLSGTIPPQDASLSTLLCVVYLGLYLGAVILAPILVIAAVIEVAWRWNSAKSFGGS